MLVSCRWKDHQCYHCKQLPTYFSFYLSIFSLKRLKFGAQVGLPSATWNTSGSSQLLRHHVCNQCLPHHLPKRYRYCSFWNQEWEADALKNTASSPKETPAKREMKINFSEVKSRGRPALFVRPLAQQEISLKSLLLHFSNPGEKGTLLRLSVCGCVCGVLHSLHLYQKTPYLPSPVMQFIKIAQICYSATEMEIKGPGNGDPFLYGSRRQEKLRLLP